MLELLIGMIASGKSSYAKARAKQGAIIVNDDAIVTTLHGGDYTLYDRGLKPLYKHVENSIITMALSFGRDVVLDRPCLKRLTRARYIGLANSLDVPVRGVIFEVKSPEIHANRRIAHDLRGHKPEYWHRVCEAHHRQYEAPTTEEGFEELVGPAEALELASDFIKRAAA